MIPPKLEQFTREPGRFFTYSGIVHTGLIVTHTDSKSLFIVPNSKLREYQSQKTKNLELLKSISIEIPDEKIISSADTNFEENSEHPQIDTIYLPVKKARRLFIFGAGASTYSVDENKSPLFAQDKLRPPLGLQLFEDRFDDILKLFPGAEALIPKFEVDEMNLEEIFQSEWNKIQLLHNPLRLSKLISTQYYLQALFEKISFHARHSFIRHNLYRRLINSLLNEDLKDPIGIVSFNYDTLLESSLEQIAQEKFHFMNDYGNLENDFILFKPHGSCNWGWELKNDKYTEGGMKRIPSTFFEKKTDLNQIYFDAIGKPSETMHQSGFGYEKSRNSKGMGFQSINKELIKVLEPSSKFYPAMLIPFKDKDEFLMPYSHQTKLDIVLNDIEEIVCIGWKGNENSFNRTLSKQATRLKRITIVDPEHSTVEDNLKKHLNRKDITYDYHKGFLEYVKKLK